MDYTVGCDADGRLTAVKARMIGDSGRLRLGRRQGARARGRPRVRPVPRAATSTSSRSPSTRTTRRAARCAGSAPTRRTSRSKAAWTCSRRRPASTRWEIRWRNALEVGDTFSTGQVLEKSVGIKKTLLAVKAALRRGARPQGARSASPAASRTAASATASQEWGKARLVVEPDGTVSLYNGYTEMGQGLLTVLVAVRRRGDRAAGRGVPAEGRLDLRARRAARPPARARRCSAGARSSSAAREAARRPRRAAVARRPGRPRLRRRRARRRHDRARRADVGDRSRPTRRSATPRRCASSTSTGASSGSSPRTTSAARSTRRSARGRSKGSIHMGLGYALTEELPCDDGMPVDLQAARPRRPARARHAGGRGDPRRGARAGGAVRRQGRRRDRPRADGGRGGGRARGVRRHPPLHAADEGLAGGAGDERRARIQSRSDGAERPPARAAASGSSTRTRTSTAASRRSGMPRAGEPPRELRRDPRARLVAARPRARRAVAARRPRALRRRGAAARARRRSSITTSRRTSSRARSTCSPTPAQELGDARACSATARPSATAGATRRGAASPSAAASSRPTAGRWSRGVVGLHASFTVSDETIREAGDLCRELGTVLHVHVAEDRADVRRRAAPRHTRGRSSGCGARRAAAGFDPRARRAPDRRRRCARAADAGCWLVQNPRSNRNNRVGYPRALGDSRARRARHRRLPVGHARTRRGALRRRSARARRRTGRAVAAAALGRGLRAGRGTLRRLDGACGSPRRRRGVAPALDRRGSIDGGCAATAGRRRLWRRDGEAASRSAAHGRGSS